MAWFRLLPWLVAAVVGAVTLALLVPALSVASWFLAVALASTSIYAWSQAHRMFIGHQADLAQLEQEITTHQGQVRRHRAALDDLADGLDVLVFLTDARQTILYANRAAMETFGNQEPTGMTLLAVTLSNELAEAVQSCLDSGRAPRIELTLRHPDERTFIVSAWQGDQEQDRIFVSLYDITSLRHLERVRRDFVANVSHELRTPMTTIRAMAETLAEGDNDKALTDKFLDKIVGEVDRLTRITEDLLTLSVAESGSTEKTDCDAAEIVRSVVQQLQPKAKKKGLDLTYSGPVKAPVRANETQLAQVAMNLVDNAINYSSEGQVLVNASLQDGMFELRVADSGIGIASEHLPRIFERFYRVDKGRSRASGGTGLGLSIVRHIAEAHGGKVAVQSELNRGSTFTVTIPVD